MRFRLVVIAEWTKDAQNVNVPNIIPLVDGESRNDITGQGIVPPDPNAVVWEVFTADVARYEADTNIFILSIEELPNEQIS